MADGGYFVGGHASLGGGALFGFTAGSGEQVADVRLADFVEPVPGAAAELGNEELEERGVVGRAGFVRRGSAFFLTGVSGNEPLLSAQIAHSMAARVTVSPFPQALMTGTAPCGVETAASAAASSACARQ